MKPTKKIAFAEGLADTAFGFLGRGRRAAFTVLRELFFNRQLQRSATSR
jgi:hypothetical protein